MQVQKFKYSVCPKTAARIPSTTNYDYMINIKMFPKIRSAVLIDVLSKIKSKPDSFFLNEVQIEINNLGNYIIDVYKIFIENIFLNIITVYVSIYLLFCLI